MDNRNENMTEDLLYLSDDNDQKMAFHFLDLIVYHEQEYMVLLPAEGPYVDEVVILQRQRLPDGGEAFAGVEDLNTIHNVYKLFQQRAGDAFIYTDGN